LGSDLNNCSNLEKKRGEGDRQLFCGDCPFQSLFKEYRDCPPSSTKKVAGPLFYLLFGPAQFFLDQIKVVPFGRGDEMEFKIAALYLDHIILHHQSPTLAVECEEDFFP
jgi:hypothetical protein